MLGNLLAKQITGAYELQVINTMLKILRIGHNKLGEPKESGYILARFDIAKAEILETGGSKWRLYRVTSMTFS